MPEYLSDMLTSQLIETPVGTMTAIVDDRGLVLFEFSGPRRLPGQLARVHALFGETPELGEHAFLNQTRAELEEYFAGRREDFTIPLVVTGTPFQESVWHQLLRIPFGNTSSYEQIARRIGRPGAARAVGRANGDNRIAIIIPCHRVIGSNGSLTGYGGGESNKRWLLDHEQRGATQMSLPSLGANETGE
jgi:O-6-methylguanine DNA methyltransferase